MDLLPIWIFLFDQSFPSITVTSPNGGENWIVGSSHKITWTSSDVANVKIHYAYHISGFQYLKTIVESIPNANGSYNWIIPNTPATDCAVIITDDSNSSVNDISDAVFTISEQATSTITVTSPTGGENWQVGSSHDVSWTSTSVTNVKVEYSTNNGTNWTSIVSSTSSDGSYSWTIPNTPSSNCKVKISDAANSSVYDQSNNVFTICSQPTSTIAVTLPNGDEELKIRSFYQITWASNTIDNVKIELSTDNGGNWINLVQFTKSDGSYGWTVPNILSTNCRVKISSVSNIYINDQSDNSFTIKTGQFTEQTSISLRGIEGGTAIWGDYNNDGNLDILVTGNSNSGYISKIYRNNGDNTFSEQNSILPSNLAAGNAALGRL